ncbi:L-2,4-diaminobutyric acid acetyltransferase [Rhodococcoides trifolii]|uniref:L-2,4-diaminobutyric acid acetyltransferase n=1 Tax=Rhodococcoides trifolii TaxID=908250 RepID=A0A917D114_9NOCA|nr:diaminobutyrate acetyltransferase [Rhodococcus trifolii]GGG02595.1 L-2,4-diaminobutyric acid acetyltransferase [Rhodococcus trifolii]
MTPVLPRATPTTSPSIDFREPTKADGIRLWEIARDSSVLDVNSSYAYVLWCRDFARTSIVAVADDRVTSFVTGYIRPESPTTLFVWQVAVDADQRGKGLAGSMLGQLVSTARSRGVTHLETTISPDNGASIALFTALARRTGTGIERRDLFDTNDFPDAHEPEHLYTIGPFSVAP